MALGARRWLSSIFADLLATLHTAESERCVAAVAATADCVSCSITMVHCEVGELDFVSKFDFMKGFPLVPMNAKPLLF